MIGYFVWVAIGIACAFGARRLVGPTTALGEPQRTGVLLFAVGGAILGAYGLELPADRLGWSAPIGDGALPLGGRTVLGGLIGGWLAVEAGKRAFGIRVATGDDFALPLAIALGFGRLGCLSAGCCGGRACEPGPLAWTDAQGVARVPVQLVEAGFHFIAAIALFVAIRRGALGGRRLAVYLTAYAALRFVLEGVRENPVVALGLTWYQFLALVLFALAATTWWRRSRSIPTVVGNAAS